MNSLSLMLERATRAVVRVVLLMAALGLAAAVVASAVAVLLLASLWAVLRGRRPPVVTVYRFTQQVSRQVWARRQGPFGSQGPGRRSGSRGASGRVSGRRPADAVTEVDVVDVETREVPDRPGAR